MAEAGKITIPIGGMTCQHCVQSVHKTLVAQPGVTSAEVNLEKGEAVITGTGLDAPGLRAAIEDLGFDAGDVI